MTKVLTKYKYNLYDLQNIFVESCYYQRLVILGLKSVLTVFKRKQVNKVKHKEYLIERISS